MSNRRIRKLPKEIINKIAAGEVVERPASIVKELIDNALDAGATTIEISVRDGGINEISISDNGSGIPREELPLAFETHATSKIITFEDLHEILTMGFRGEALPTIAEISKVKVISKSVEEEDGYEATLEGSEIVEIKDKPRQNGTTISVGELFHNVPGRKKFLRSADTEYRYILKVLIPYFLAYPQIHFKLNKDGKTAYNLPSSTLSGEEAFSENRVKEVVQADFTENMLPLFFDGSGIKVSGFVAHPSYHTRRTTHTYLIINSRPISDKGVYKSVLNGFGSFIPHGDKIPFVISLEVAPSMVDVNVHPRKEEVRFTNPYRVYSAVESAVAESLRKNMSFSAPVSSSTSEADAAVLRFRSEEPSYTPMFTQPSRPATDSHSSINEIKINNRTADPSGSIRFSRELLDRSEFSQSTHDEKPEVNSTLISQLRSVHQIFNKYIMYEFADQLWVMDQHAAAERITYERLLRDHEKSDPDVQQLLVPITLEITDQEALYLKEIEEKLNRVGFTFTVEGNGISFTEVPIHFTNSDLGKMIKDLLQEDGEGEGRDLEEGINALYATIACHSSIRTSQRLEREESVSLLEQLSDCSNPYSCPHGRPIIWKLTLSEIDSNFDRTY